MLFARQDSYRSSAPGQAIFEIGLERQESPQAVPKDRVIIRESDFDLVAAGFGLRVRRGSAAGFRLGHDRGYKRPQTSGARTLTRILYGPVRTVSTELLWS